MLDSKLTEGMTGFLQKFIIGKKKDDKQKINTAYTDYLKRQDAVLKEIAKGNVGLEQSLEGINAAHSLAEDGNFKAAYVKLESVRKETLLFAGDAKKKLAKFNLLDLLRAIGELDYDLSLVRKDADLVISDTQKLAFPEKNQILAKSSDVKATLDEATRLRLLGETLPQRAASVQQAIRKVGAPERIKEFEKDIALVELAGTEKQKNEVAAARDDLSDVGKRQQLDGKPLWEADLETPARNAVLTMTEWWSKCGVVNQDQLLDDIKKVDDTFKQSKLKPLDSKVLKELKDREDQRLQRAKDEMQKAMQRDAKLCGFDPLNPLEEPKKTKPVELRSFAFSDLGVKLDGVTAKNAKQFASGAANGLKLLMESELKLNPRSDIVHELLLKSKDDFANVLVAQLGFDSDETKRSDDQQKIVETIAAAMHKQIIDSAPAKLSNDHKSLTLGGVTYKRSNDGKDKDGVLGRGANGEVVSFVDENGNKRVVKFPKKPEDRKAVATEAEMHHRAMGGENGENHPNIVQMHGVALDGKGNLFIVLDQAEGGTAEDLSLSMRAVEQSGALSGAARDALTRKMFLDVVRGMKQLHDTNMTHNDIKEANFLVTGDGRIQVADFGSGGETDDAGNFAAAETREGEQARNRKYEEVEEQIQTLEKQLADLKKASGKEDSNTGTSDGGGKDGKTEDNAEDTLQKLTDELVLFNTMLDDLSKPGLAAFKHLGMMKQDYMASGKWAPTTQQYAAPEVLSVGQRLYSKKSDVFSLGGMLDVMTKDYLGQEFTESNEQDEDGIFKVTYARTSRQTKQKSTGEDLNTSTALDRLRNAMLQPDLDKRPSLDDVLGSAYLETSDFPDDDPSDKDGGGSAIRQLQTAVGQYNKAVGREISGITEQINKSVHKIHHAYKLLNDAQDKEALVDLTTKKITELQDSIDKGRGREDFDSTKAEQELKDLQAQLEKQKDSAKQARQVFEKIAKTGEDLVKLEESESKKQTELRKKLDVINQRPAVAKLLEEIKQLSDLVTNSVTA